MSDPAPSVREEIGFVHAPTRAKAPTPAIEHVRFTEGEGWEAQVRRASGKRVWLYRATERDARDAALAEVRR